MILQSLRQHIYLSDKHLVFLFEIMGLFVLYFKQRQNKYVSCFISVLLIYLLYVYKGIYQINISLFIHNLFLFQKDTKF